MSESSDTNTAKGCGNIFDRIISVGKYHPQLIKIFLEYFPEFSREKIIG